jgi:hypothetical protein
MPVAKMGWLQGGEDRAPYTLLGHDYATTILQVDQKHAQ